MAKSFSQLGPEKQKSAKRLIILLGAVLLFALLYFIFR